MKINFCLPLFPEEHMNTGSKVGGMKHIKINAYLLGPPTEKCPHQNGSSLLSLPTGRTPEWWEEALMTCPPCASCFGGGAEQLPRITTHTIPGTSKPKSMF